MQGIRLLIKDFYFFIFNLEKEKRKTKTKNLTSGWTNNNRVNGAEGVGI